MMRGNKAEKEKLQEKKLQKKKYEKHRIKQKISKDAIIGKQKKTLRKKESIQQAEKVESKLHKKRKWFKK